MRREFHFSADVKGFNEYSKRKICLAKYAVKYNRASRLHLLLLRTRDQVSLTLVIFLSFSEYSTGREGADKKTLMLPLATSAYRELRTYSLFYFILPNQLFATHGFLLYSQLFQDLDFLFFIYILWNVVNEIFIELNIS